MRIEYNATKTAHEFHMSQARVRLLLGALGTGKSVSTQVEMPSLAARQAHGLDGLRHTRTGIFRTTYPELKSTTIKTWCEWFPEQYFGKIKWDSPITQTVKIKDLDAEFLFIAIDGISDIQKIKSLELTNALFNEVQYTPLAVFNEILTRIDRYPPKKLGAPITRACMVADTNPPSTSHWIYDLFEKQKPEGYEIFKYAPALMKVVDGVIHDRAVRSLDGTLWTKNPAADYTRVQQNPDYWLNMVAGNDDEFIKVNACGEYGVTKWGKPVYPEYSDSLHCGEVEAVPNQQIGLGWDYGLTPAVVITQLTPFGQVKVVDEIIGLDTGIEEFIQHRVLPILNHKYPWWVKNYISIGDPAGNQRVQTDKKTVHQIVLENGIVTRPGLTQEFIKRREAVVYFLSRLVDGRSAFLMSPRCEVLRNGFKGEYFYKLIPGALFMKYSETPEKNENSHPHDGLQYLMMYYYAQTKAGRQSFQGLNNVIS